MAALGVKPDGGVLYVGDSNVDVETAHNAGLPCCGVLWGFRTREELTEAGAEYLAEDTQGLERLFWGDVSDQGTRNAWNAGRLPGDGI